MRLVKKRLLVQNIVAITTLSILVLVVIERSTPKPVLAWGSEHLYSAHYYIIEKAVEYLRKNKLLSDWPLESYTASIKYGAYFADFPYDPVGLKCDWGGFYEGTCDSVHHFRTGDCVYLTDAGVCIGDGGGLGAPDYGQTLYGLALLFWPGGLPAPNIHDLSIRQSGGYMTTKFDGRDFGPFVVGGLPFAYDSVCQDKCKKTDDWCWCYKEDAYYWPAFATSDPSLSKIASENINSSLTYLGWAIHMIEDLSTPVHAKNETGSYHKTFEDRADELIANQGMSNLPVDSGGKYSFANTIYDDFPVSPDFFNIDWTLTQFAQEASRRSIEAETPTWSDGSWGVAMDDQIEIDLDTSIKLVSGVLLKFFTELELPSDQFEPNEIPTQAASIKNGEYELTLSAPLDVDYFIVEVPDDYSDVKIAVLYNRSPQIGELVANIEYRDTDDPYWVLDGMQIVDGGRVFEDNAVPKGRKYLIEVSPWDDIPKEYSLNVYVGKGDLPLDKFEPNNTSFLATELPTSTSFNAEASLDNDSDIDYYKIQSSGYSIYAELIYDSSAGNIKLSIDNIQALTSNIEDSNKIVKSITSCGASPSMIKIEGNKGFYKLNVLKRPLQSHCDGYYTDWIILNTIGQFDYTGMICSPGEVPVSDSAIARDRSYGKKTDNNKPYWSFAVWLDKTDWDFYFPLVMDVACNDIGDEPEANIKVKILKAGTLDQITWSGSGTGTCFGVDNSNTMKGFKVSLEMESALYSYCALPGHGILTIEAYKDNDRDGLPDIIEERSGTDINDDDTDNDGMLDGTEDKNHDGIVNQDETDPHKWDSDGDNLSDGVEIGLSNPEGINTDLGVYKRDDDPMTTTDPLNPDTDRDTMPDGQEDKNGNGRVDPGETSPLSGDIKPTVVPLPTYMPESTNVPIPTLLTSPSLPTTNPTITLSPEQPIVGNDVPILLLIVILVIVTILLVLIFRRTSR